jgi:DnaJ-domain-containing protein 1
MAYNHSRFEAMELRRKLRDRVEELNLRVKKCSVEALERVFYERMDTYFAQEERLEEMSQLLIQIFDEVDQEQDINRLKRIAERLTYLEDHYEQIDSVMYDRPARPRQNRFNFFKFFRQWQADTSGAKNEINNEAEAYRELGLETHSSLKEVKVAFRRLIKQLHPDRHQGDRSTEPQLRKLVAAYEFIKKRR